MLCSGAQIFDLRTYYAQYYAHVKDLCLNLTVLLEYIYLYHKNTITGANNNHSVDVLLEYIDL